MRTRISRPSLTLSPDSRWLVALGMGGRLGARSDGLYWPIAPKEYRDGAYAETILVVMPLETARLVLREYSYDDWPTVLAYQSDPRYLRYYPWSERDAATVRDWIAGLVARQRDEPREVFQLAITLPDQGGQLIGSCGVRVNDRTRRE